MLDHVSLGVSDLERAVSFYDAVLAALGYYVWTPNAMERVWRQLKGPSVIRGPDVVAVGQRRASHELQDSRADPEAE